MKLAATLVTSLLLAAGAAAGAAPPERVLGVAWGPAGGELAWLDPLSLRPVPGPRLRIGPPPIGVGARSPDGATIALGSGGAILRFVDLRRMRSLGELALGSGSLAAALWPERARLLVVARVSDVAAELVVVDPLARRVLARRVLDGSLVGTVPTRTGLVLLFGLPGAIGPGRLAVVDARGEARAVDLDQIRSGSQTTQRENDVSVRQETPGLAVDPAGGRALVVPAVGPVAEVDLGTMSVAYHALATRTPAAAARAEKALSGYARSALWLGGGLVAVSGTDYATSVDAQGQERQRGTASGLTLIDTRDWSARLVEPRASELALVAGTLLAFGTSWDSSTPGSTGMGLTGYALDGSPRFHLFGDEPVAYVQAAGPYAYEGSDNSTVFRIVDVRSGTVVGRTTTAKPTTLLDGG